MGALWASRGEAVRGHIGPQFFPPAWTARYPPVLAAFILPGDTSCLLFLVFLSVIMSAVAGVKKVKKVTKTTSKKVRNKLKKEAKIDEC